MQATQPNDNNKQQALHPQLNLDDIVNGQAVDIPSNIDPHSTNLYYKIRELASIIQKQKLKIKDQSEALIGLHKEIDTHKRNQAMLDNTERELRKAHEKVHQLEKLNDGIYGTEQKKIKELQAQIEDLKRAKGHEQATNRKNLDVFHQKIEASNFIEMENRINKEEIEELKAEKQKLLKDTEETIRKKEIKNQNKYSQLKKKMVENLAETKKNVTNLNLEYIDVSNKLTVLQNHQLIMQIEYQAEKIEELEREKDYLLQKTHDLQRELIVHKEVELSLAEKVKSKQQCPNSNGSANNESSHHLIRIAEMKKDINFSHLEKRIITLEKSLKEKTTELERQKLNNSALKHRINRYETKYAGLFNFFEDSLSNFSQDDKIAQNKDLYVNIDQIQKCDFTLFSSEEKYALLVLMMKYLLPIVSLNMDNNYSLGNGIFETNLNLVSKSKNLNEKYLKDHELKKAFLGKNNKINADLVKGNVSYCLTQSFPIMKKTKSETDPRLGNSKYKAVFI